MEKQSSAADCGPTRGACVMGCPEGINLSEVLAGKQSAALGGHIRPDGDCVGSCMGLYMYLREQYPNMEIDVYLEEIPDAFRMIQRTDEAKNYIPDGKQYDLFICLDCGDERRLGFSSPLFQNAKQTLCIDHHVSNDAFADINYIIPDASSTSELVFGLLEKTKISRSAAEALYMGIAHDTGVFQYSCTSPETMEAAAELLRKGINGNDIIEKTFYEKTYIQNQILGRALLESILILEKRCIVSAVSKSEMEFYEAKPSDLEGIVSQMKLTQGTEVACFMYELETQHVKVSLRSKGRVDVSVIAQYFGGGGHARAAGFSMKGTYHDVINNVSARIALQLDQEEMQV